MPPVEWALLVVLALLWGGSFFFAKVAIAILPPLTLVLLRVAPAALTLALVLRGHGRPLPRDPRVWVAFAVMAALNNVLPFSLIFWGQTRIASGLAAILNATTPLFAVLLGQVLTRGERLSPQRVVALLLGFAGVVTMMGASAWQRLDRDLVAELAVLAGAFCYAGAGIFGRRFRQLPPAVTAAGQLIAATCLILPLALAVDGLDWLPRASPRLVAAVAGLSLLSTALGYVIYFRLLRAVGAVNLLLVTFLIPVTAVALGAVFLGERVDLAQGVGMALISIGLAVIDGRPKALLSTGWSRVFRRRPEAGRGGDPVP